MPDTYPSDELQDQDRPIVEQLERMYGTQAEDAQSLARIRARIVQNSAGPLPFPHPTLATEDTPVQLQRRRTKETDMRLIRIITSREKSWPRRLSVLAAALFVMILVGSLVLVLARKPQGSVAGLPPLQPGWRQVALLSGSSSKTFTHQDIVLSTLWGMSFGCVGQGKVDIEFDGQINNSASGTCQQNTEPVLSDPYGPQTIELETSVHTIQTVKVTVSGSINWYLQLSNATVTPSPLLSELLAPGSGWQETSAMGSAGVSMEGYLADPSHGITLPDGRTVYPGIWGIVVVCSGTGKVSIQLEPAVKGVQIPTPLCNEQPTLDILHLASSRIIVSPDSKVVWQIRVLACIDEQACLKH